MEFILFNLIFILFDFKSLVPNSILGTMQFMVVKRIFFNVICNIMIAIMKMKVL